MTGVRSASRPRWREIAAILSRDSLLGFLACVAVLLALDFFFPELTRNPSGSFDDLVVIPVALLAILHRLQEIKAPEERRFWTFMALALACWWSVWLTYVLVPRSWWGPTADMITDGIYLVFYLVIFLAAASKPHLRSEKVLQGRRQLETIGILVLVFGLLTYFVVIPVTFRREVYETWLPSLHLFAALDLVLATRFVQLAHDCGSFRWRLIYGLLGLAAAMWTVLDFLEGLSFVKLWKWPQDSVTEMVWSVPLLLLIVAARVRHLPFPEEPQPKWADSEHELRMESPLLVAAFIFPVLHLVLSNLQLLDAETRTAREITVLVGLLVLGFLALLENRVLGIRSRQLEDERRELSAELRLTQEREAEELRHARDAAEQANRSKSEFLANMSHEIRTPLSAVVGFSELMLKSGRLDPRQLEYAQSIATSAESLLEVIDDILDFSRIEAGKLTIETVDFELRSTLSKVVGLLGPRATAKGLAMRLDIDPSVAERLRGDPGRLCQVLINLVGNAIKFTEKGSVTIRVIRERFDSDFVRFRVEDTGIGIPRHERARLFRPFSQLDASASRSFGGTGLGLSISRQIVELMGGEVGVESEPGRGSTFWISLPLSPALEPLGRSETPRTDPARIDAARAEYRILLAEDNELVRLVASHQIRSLGYRVDAVASGHEALRALGTRSYDLLLLDDELSDSDETARRIRQTEATQRLPVIALTDTPDGADRPRDPTSATGVDAAIAKPVHESELAGVLHRWLPLT